LLAASEALSTRAAFASAPAAPITRCQNRLDLLQEAKEANM